MPPEATTPQSSWRQEGVLDHVPENWRGPLGLFALSFLGLGVVTAREWGEMFHQWWNIDTYSHILLVPLILIWLVWLRTDELQKITPKPWAPGLLLIAAGLGLWLVGRLTDINLFAHAGAVGAVQGAVVATLGLRASIALALPLAFATFLVPFGDELIPALQMVTAEIAIALTHLSGIPAVVDGIYIETPVGLFIVAEACSGVKFLIAMITLAVLVCFTRFDSWRRRIAFLAASIIIPIIANGIRAWGTIYIAQSQGVEFAAGFDHIFYGWIFFAIVVVVLIAGAWRYFEREPDDHGWTADEIQTWPWLDKAEQSNTSVSAAAGAIAAMALAAAMIAAIVDPMAIS
ncbi:exosortase A [Erythrobacter crassostreae]|uniref:Exosortase A n=1 Tax=Erythrobacter crassostreae TaxID=2828328 RepID=A0A9X1JN80_9SPHN|nr:exosortase A [Erythrobacter crassostrea]MBV7260184.1 exosortase A [Erythrobacter crassostrea]